MSDRCPDEAARRGEPADRAELDALRREARVATVERRGGAALISREHPASRTDPVLAAALAGDPGSLVVVGTLDDMIVGYMLAEATDTAGAGRVASLVELWVTPQARKLGVGEAMMAEVLTWARARDCDEIDADALPGDRDTKNFYELHGLVAREIKVSRRLD